MAPNENPEAKAAYAVLERFVDAALGSDGSMFTPGRPIWTVASLEDFRRRLATPTGASPASGFEAKLERQLAGASAPAVQLAAEAVYVHLLVAKDISGGTKRALVTKVLGWAPQPVEIPGDLAAALDGGFVSTGVAFKAYRPNQVAFLVDFCLAWKRAPEEERSRALDDPWAFKELLWRVPVNGAFAQRNALLHYVHPETFEDIVSRDHKRRIVERLGLHAGVGADGDVDRALLAIRARFGQERGAQGADLLDALNRRIADPDFAVGPSYLMRDRAHRPGGLERVWKRAILPLLEERFYGTGADVEAEYGLAALRASLASRPVADVLGREGLGAPGAADPAR